MLFQRLFFSSLFSLFISVTLLYININWTYQQSVSRSYDATMECYTVRESVAVAILVLDNISFSLPPQGCSEGVYDVVDFKGDTVCTN